jgi:hypothetical protein
MDMFDFGVFDDRQILNDIDRLLDRALDGRNG